MIRSVRPGLEAETVSARTGPWAARSPPLHQISRFAGKLGNRRRLARPEGRFPLRVHLRLARDCALRWRLHVLVADAVGRARGARGVDVVFGLMGSGNRAVTNALRDAGVPFHASRHECGAVCMADGYARVSGGLAVCSVHQGPGLTNAVTGLTEAAKARTPLIVLAADVPAAALRSNFRIDQTGLVEAVGAVAERVHRPETALAAAPAAAGPGR